MTLTAVASDLRVPFLDLRAQHRSIAGELEAAIDRVVESGQFILGPEVAGLETEVAAYCGTAHGVGVSSGTDALLAALMALEIGPGDEVVTTPYTFMASAGTIARLGARPVFVDVDPATFCLDPALLGAAIGPKTRAILPVHLFGRLAAMGPILEVAARHGLPVVEDAAQAIGAERDGRRAGSLGRLGCLSFFPSKNLGAMGDGGMVVTDDEALADRLRLLRNHGHRPKYTSVILGGNFRLDALQAAVLRVKLRRLDGWTRARQANAALYRHLLAEAGVLARGGVELAAGGRVLLADEVLRERHVFNQLVVRCAPGERDPLRAFLAERGVATEVYYPLPMHLQPCFADLGHARGDFPESERAAAETLALPVFPELGEEAIRRVVALIVAFCERSGRRSETES